jgi:hypothetical protein
MKSRDESWLGEHCMAFLSYPGCFISIGSETVDALDLSGCGIRSRIYDALQCAQRKARIGILLRPDMYNMAIHQ